MKFKKEYNFYFIINFLVIISLFFLNIYIFFMILFLSNLVIFLFIKFFEIYKKYKLKKKFEKALVNEILVISSVLKTNDLNLIIEKLSNSREEIIKYEFKSIKSKINKGYSPKKALLYLKEKYDSKLISRFVDLFINMISLGTIESRDFENIITNFLKQKDIINKRKNLLLIQKYTIILSSGFILPSILGAIISISSSLKTNVSLTFFSSSTLIFEVSKYCSIIYILEFAIISSIYLSYIEESKKKFIIYLVFLLPISLIIFFVFKSLI